MDRVEIKMEILVEVKKSLLFLGFLQFDHQHKKLISFIQTVICFCIGGAIFSLPSIFFFFYEAKTFAEQTESIFDFACGALLSMFYGILLWQRKQVLELIAKLESQIHKRVLLFMMLKFLFQPKY